MRTSDSTVKLVEALVAARAAFTPVLRDAIGQVGSDRQYKYADLGSVLEATMPALTANGLAVLQAVDAETSTLITRVAHTSGEWVESSYALTINLPPQQFGSSLTYARRYSLQSLLCLAAEDDDGATAQPPPSKRATKDPKKDEGITQAQRKRLFAMASAAGWTTEQLKDYLQRTYQIASSKDITAATYDSICRDFDRPPGAAGEMPF
jgi:hypothetical protein